MWFSCTRVNSEYPYQLTTTALGSVFFPHDTPCVSSLFLLAFTPQSWTAAQESPLPGLSARNNLSRREGKWQISEQWMDVWPQLSQRDTIGLLRILQWNHGSYKMIIYSICVTTNRKWNHLHQTIKRKTFSDNCTHYINSKFIFKLSRTLLNWR